MNFMHAMYLVLYVIETGVFSAVLWKVFTQYYFTTSKISLCKNDFTMTGCYRQRNPKNLLFEDWSKIRRSSMIGYIKRLACKCGAAARKAGFRGFALYGWGGCYGRTRASLQRLAHRKKDYSLCIGNQIKENCEREKHSYCIGRGDAETVYVLHLKEDDGPGEWQKWSKCSKLCGRGVRERKWKCLYPRVPGNVIGCPEFDTKVQYQSCKIQECPGKMICESRHTSFQTDGNGYLTYLARHNLKCKSNNAMTMFHLQKSGHGMRYQFSCCRKKANACTLKRKVTRVSSHGNWKINVLHKHKLECGAGSFLTQFFMEMTQLRNGLRYVYYCCNLQVQQKKKGPQRTRKPKCYNSKTQFSTAGNGKVHHLDQQVVSCRQRYALTSVGQEMHKDQTKVRYRFRCCEFY